MIDVYTWPTPNGHKVHIALEELGLPYTVHAVDIGEGDQFKPEFLKISPNNRIPAIVDQDGPKGKPLALFESGAILIYLAEKAGSLLAARACALPSRRMADVPDGRRRPDAGPGPSFQRLYAPEKIPYAIERYTNEASGSMACWTAGSAEADTGGREYEHRGHRHLPLDRAIGRRQGVALAGYPQRAALARTRRKAARGRSARLKVLADRVDKQKPFTDRHSAKSCSARRGPERR